MADDYKKLETNEPRRLGEYLTCSRGSIVMAIKKKLESLERGNDKKGLGEFLLELGIISTYPPKICPITLRKWRISIKEERTLTESLT